MSYQNSISCCIHSFRVQVVLSVHQVPSAEREQRVSVVETQDQALLVSQVVRSVLASLSIYVIYNQ